MYLFNYLREKKDVDRRELSEGDDRILRRVSSFSHLRQLSEEGFIDMEADISFEDYVIRLIEKGVNYLKNL